MRYPSIVIWSIYRLKYWQKIGFYHRYLHRPMDANSKKMFHLYRTQISNWRPPREDNSNFKHFNISNRSILSTNNDKWIVLMQNALFYFKKIFFVFPLTGGNMHKNETEILLKWLIQFLVFFFHFKLFLFLIPHKLYSMKRPFQLKITEATWTFHALFLYRFIR